MQKNFTEQLLKELDGRSNILNKLLDDNIFKELSNFLLQSNVMGVLPRQTCHNVEKLHVSFQKFSLTMSRS